ncbi:Sugar transport protein 14, partial [Bienertia sinuspersici]
MNSILFYAPVFFQSLGFNTNVSLYSSTITNGALVIAALISMALVDKFGRRAFYIEAGIEMLCEMVAVGIILAIYFGDGKDIPKGIGYFLVSRPEYCCLRQHDLHCIDCTMFPSVSLSPQVWNLPVVCRAHLHYDYLVFFFLPETKQVPIEEVIFLWRNHWFWKSYVSEEEVKAHTGG